ncbi:MAG: hypothetical protein ACKO1N_10405 [Erythrobacter sp.]
MKSPPFAALGLVLAAMMPALAIAQNNMPAPMPAAPAPAALFTIDAPIEALMADERAKAVIVKYLAGIDQHPAYNDFKGLSLKTLAPFSQGLISEETLGKIAADLAAIK